MQAFLIVLIVLFTFILIGVNVYILLLYVHPDDKNPTTSPLAKTIIILGLTFCQAQALMIPLDVANQTSLISLSDQYLKMGILWSILYLTLLAFICILIPYSIFYYQSDPQHSLGRRLGRSVAYLFLTLLISALILFVTWPFLKFVELPFNEINVSQIYVDRVVQVKESRTFEFQASFAIYVISIMSFVGWFFLISFGGVGLFALPIDLINQFRNRPKVRKSQEMKITRDELARTIKTLLKQGEEVTTNNLEYQRNEEAGCFEKFRGKRKSNTAFNKFKVRYHLLHEQFEIFNLELKLADTNPIIPYIKLCLGVIFILTSIIWIVQIIGSAILSNYSPTLNFRFFDNMLAWLDHKNAGVVSLFIFAYLCLYMMWCVQKGSIKLGMRIPFICRFNPMKQNQTSLNGLLVNVLFLILASVAVMFLCIQTFPKYTRNTEIETMVGVTVTYMKFYRIFYTRSIFEIALLCFTGLTLLYVLVTCNKKPRYMQEIEMIRRVHGEQIDRLK